LCFASAGWNATAQETTAGDILEKMEGKYASLTSLALSGRVITDIDMSGGKTKADAPRTDDLGQSGRILTFNIRLAKPALYRIAWSQTFAAIYTNKGAIWSSGSGHFILIDDKNRPMEGGLDKALSSGVSGGVASTLGPLFFALQPNQFSSLHNLALLPEETIGTNLCYVLSGDSKGSKVILWITKDYWLKQRKVLMGGNGKMPEISDHDITDALKMRGQTATPEAVAQMRETMESIQAMTSSMKGSITEIYETSEANPPLTKESFESDSPPPNNKPAN
jgi:outer membrane lipoprotein-sorting protein